MEIDNQFNIIYYDFLDKKAQNIEFILTIWVTHNNGKYELSNNDLPHYRASDFFFSCVVTLKDCLLDHHVLQLGTINKCILIFEIKNIISQNMKLTNKNFNILNNKKDICVLVDTDELYQSQYGINLFNFCDFDINNINFCESSIIVNKKKFNMYDQSFIDGEYLLHFFQITQNVNNNISFSVNNDINNENNNNTDDDICEMIDFFNNLMRNC